MQPHVGASRCLLPTDGSRLRLPACTSEPRRAPCCDGANVPTTIVLSNTTSCSLARYRLAKFSLAEGSDACEPALPGVM